MALRCLFDSICTGTLSGLWRYVPLCQEAIYILPMPECVSACHGVKLNINNILRLRSRGTVRSHLEYLKLDTVSMYRPD